MPRFPRHRPLTESQIARLGEAARATQSTSGDITFAEHMMRRWRFSTAAAALTPDEALVIDSMRNGLKNRDTRQADVLRAKTDTERYAAHGPGCWDWGERYDEAMAECLKIIRDYRENGMPRRWPAALPNFWYWVAIRQNWE